jgi:chemotaxis signal transduction protein
MGDAMKQYLTFELDRRFYGVGVEFVNSVLDPQAVTPLPRAATIVTGLTNVRGNVVPVFDPRETLARTKVDDERISRSLSDAEAGEGGSGEVTVLSGDDAAEEGGIIIFEIDNGTLLPFIGLQADRIGKVILLEDTQLAAVPDFLPESASRYYEGFCFVSGVRHSILNLKELAARDTLFMTEGVRRG